MSNYIWENFNNSKLKELRDSYHLTDVVKSGKSEFEKQLLLKDWVHKKLPNGNNIKRDYKSALEILSDTKTGQFYCSHYALTFIQTSSALNWYSRKLSIDYDHQQGEEEKHHGIADIWSNDFHKWYAVDAMNNLHFEKNGLPLNVLEIRNEYIKNKATDIVGIVGVNDKHLTYGKDTFGFDQPSNYFWFFILLRNNFFEDPEIYNGQSLLWTDEYNTHKFWYKGGGKKGKSELHPQYNNQFIPTNDIDLCFPYISC